MPKPTPTPTPTPTQSPDRRRRARTIFRALLGVLMILSGILHFANPDPYIMMMPDYLPAHAQLVLISGVFELLLGVALFVPKARPVARWGLIALLIAVLPANIWMASEGIQPPGMEMSTPVAWIRVVLQAGFIWWAWAVTRPDAPDAAAPVADA